MTNLTDFNKLKPNQPLYMIRYSHHDHPDFITIKFIHFSDDVVEYAFNNSKGKLVKKAKLRKACYRIFLDVDEMARTLYDCFQRRKMTVSEKYSSIMTASQENRPELWV